MYNETYSKCKYQLKQIPTSREKVLQLTRNTLLKNDFEFSKP